MSTTRKPARKDPRGAPTRKPGGTRPARHAPPATAVARVSGTGVPARPRPDRTRADGAPAASRELPDDRRQVLVAEAARLFGSKGYENTSMRDIAAAVGILPGSLYHHFPSKEALFVAVYSSGVSQIRQAVENAVADHTDPWARLEAACAAHLQTLLVKDSFAAAVISHLSIGTLPMRAELVTLRDRYEAVFERLIRALPLPSGTDRRTFRLGLLGAMNWSLAWYRPNGDPPSMIARKLVALLRR